MPVHTRFFLDSSQNLNPSGLQVAGPILNVEVSLPGSLAEILSEKGDPIPAPAAGWALLDTGASRTCVDGETISGLGVNPIGLVPVGSAAGQAQHSLYPARLRFPAEGLDIDFSSVVSVDLTGQAVEGQPITALIGRDLLARCMLVYNGPGGFFTLAL